MSIFRSKMNSFLILTRSMILRQQTIEQLRKLHISAINEAARKGTREKARKKKVKVEVQKIGFIPHNQRKEKRINLQRQNKHVDDSWKQIPTDNVYIGKYYRWRTYSVADAIQCHRETHHPTMYNRPNAPLNVEIELNMIAEKNNRFVDNFQRIAMIPHKFDHGEDRKILVFTKGQEQIEEAREAGASLVGGIDLIKDITNGDLLLTDYQYVIAHPNILAELVALRGLLKRRFPNPRNENLGPNLKEMIIKFSNGISYSAAKDEHQADFGLISTSIGKLDMETQHLEDNLIALLKDVNTIRPKREGRFITRVLLKSPPSSEQFKIDPFLYVEENYDKNAAASKKIEKVESIREDEPEIKHAAAAAN